MTTAGPDACGALRQVLEQLRRGEDGGIVERTGKELNADREVLRRE